MYICIGEKGRSASPVFFRVCQCRGSEQMHTGETPFLLVTASEGKNMDEDVIDISWMNEEQLRTHLRRVSDYVTCPCVRCVAVCDTNTIEHCDAYHLWKYSHERVRKGILRNTGVEKR